MKVKQKLPLKIILLAILPLLLVSVIATFYAANTAINTRKSSLEDVSDAVVEHMLTFYTSQVSNLEFSSKIPSYIQLLENIPRASNAPEDPSLMTQAKLLLESNVKTNVDLEEVNLISLDGTVLISSHDENQGKNISTTSGFSLLSNGASFYEGLLLNPEESSHNLSLTSSIRNESGAVLGYINRVSNLSDINTYIFNFCIGDSGYLYLLDRQGNILSHHFEDRITDNNAKKPQALNDLISTMQSTTFSRKGFIEYAIHKTPILAFYQQIPQVEWILIAAMEKSEIYQEAFTIFTIILSLTLLVALVSLFIGKRIASSIVKPLSYLTQKIKEIANGDFSVRCVVSNHNDEFNDLADNINELALNLDETTKELIETNRSLDRSAHVDALTNIPNRKYIYDLLDQSFRSSKNQSIFLFDLDGFKAVNDILGHEAGDSVLQKIGVILNNLCSDTIHVARLGGDEFLLFISHFNRIKDLIDLAELLLSQVSIIQKIGQQPVKLSTSLGIAILKKTTLDQSDLIKEADTLMYEAKHSGGNAFRISETD